ncbi:hypothetical protein U9M48_024852 [Paspalum notatum var. saurae]|uniref:Uncharacterized protein n=1 Tax=Paspalum notatum var. saurae TaxID=547442 RepID=A0AAQ3TP55_PASNO
MEDPGHTLPAGSILDCLSARPTSPAATSTATLCCTAGKDSRRKMSSFRFCCSIPILSESCRVDMNLDKYLLNLEFKPLY